MILPVSFSFKCSLSIIFRTDDRKALARDKVEFSFCDRKSPVVISFAEVVSTDHMLTKIALVPE
jgi:hypothetical protein